MLNITAKTSNSVSPVIITLDDGRKFEVSGELMENGFTAYKNTLKMVDFNGGVIPLAQEKIDEVTREILVEIEKAHFSMKFLMY